VASGVRDSTTYIATRLARRATLLERNTVERLPWELVIRLNRYLELAGKLATAV
jgi:hypothetical protein